MKYNTSIVELELLVKLKKS